jgi:hypothetical protein
MNVKRSSSRPPKRQKTKEKLKNPQQPNTQAPESQEGLKQSDTRSSYRMGACQFPESQEGLKQNFYLLLQPIIRTPPESQEGLKRVFTQRA